MAEQLLVTIGAKDTASNVIKKVNSNLKYLDKEYSLAQKSSKNFDNSQEGLAKKLEYLSSKYDQNKTKLSAYNKQLEDAKRKAEEKTKVLEKLKSSFNMEEAISKSESKIVSYQGKIDKLVVSLDKEKEKLEKLKSAQNQDAEAIAKSEKNIQSYSSRIEKLNNSMDKERDHLEKLKNGEADNTAEVQKAEQQLSKWQQKIEQTTQNIKLTESEMRNLTNEIVNTNNSIRNFNLNHASESLSRTGDTLQTVGQGISNFGGKLMGLSAPFVAFGGYAAKTSITFQQAMADLQATSGATGQDFIDLGNKAKELGENTCKSATDSSKAMKYLALSGKSVKEILDLTEPSLKASVAWGADMAQATDLATDSMSALGLETSRYREYLDVCSQAQRKSNTSATQLMEAYIGCGGTLKTLNVPLQESATWLGVLANQGKKGSEAGNNFQSTLVNLIGASSTSAGALKELGVSAWDNNGNFIGLSKTLYKLRDALAKCTPQQRALFEAQIGGKTQLDTVNMLLAGCGEQYENLRVNIDNATGATEEMYEVMNNTSQGKIEAFKSKLEALGIQMGDTLLPHINDLLDKGMELMNWFSKLDSGTQKLILNTGLITFATGGALKVIGGVTQGLGGLAKAGSKVLSWLAKMKTTSTVASSAIAGVGTATQTLGQVSNAASVGGLAKIGSTLKLIGPLAGVVGAGLITAKVATEAYSSAQEVLSGNISQSTDDMSAMELIMSKLTGVQRYSNEELENMGIKYKSFSDSIAPETKQSIENISGEFRNLQLEIDNVNINNAITDEEKNSIVSKAQKLCEGVLQQISGLQSESRNKLQEAFNIDGVIDEEEQKILDHMDSGAKEIENKVAVINNNIKALQQSGALDTEEGRKELQENLLQLEDLYSQELLAKKKANQQDILAFQSEANNLDLQKASELMQEKASIRDEEIGKIRSRYDESIATLRNYYDQASEEDKGAIEKKLNALEEQRAKELDIANEKYDGYLNVINTKYPEIAENISQYDGKILSSKDLKMQEELNKMTQHYADLNLITQSGCYAIYDTSANAWHNVDVTVDETTGHITAMYDEVTRECGGYTQEMANSLENYRKEHKLTADEVTNTTSIMAQAHVNSGGQIVSANGEIIGSLRQVQKNEDGTLKGITDINKTPMTITCNADGAITSLDKVRDKTERIHDKSFTITGVFKAIGDGVKSIFGFATGTDNAPAGLATVAEEGPELILNRNRTKAALATSMSLVNLQGGEVIYNARQTKDMLNKLNTLNVNDGYFNSNSLESSKLINNTTNNYSNVSTTNNNSSMLFDYDKLGRAISSAIAPILSSSTSASKLNLRYLAEDLNPYLDKINRGNRFNRRLNNG